MNDYVAGKAMWHFGHMPAFAVMCMSKVRLFYNNVAELRQILGVQDQKMSYPPDRNT
jgi:hypothetical protein